MNPSLAKIFYEFESIIVVSQIVSDHSLSIIVYETEQFLSQSHPLDNYQPLALYSICSDSYAQTIIEIEDAYRGWSKIDRDETIELIGIHNQDPKSLFIQFALGERYFIYHRRIDQFQETVFEEQFGKKDRYKLRPLNPNDEQYLIYNLKFIPKARKAISFYSRYTNRYKLARRRRSLPFTS